MKESSFEVLKRCRKSYEIDQIFAEAPEIVDSMFDAPELVRSAALIVCIAMLFATPLIGSHYFVDIIAGIGVAVLAAAAKRLSPSIPKAARVGPENSTSALPA